MPLVAVVWPGLNPALWKPCLNLMLGLKINFIKSKPHPDITFDPNVALIDHNHKYHMIISRIDISPSPPSQSGIMDDWCSFMAGERTNEPS